MRGRVHRSDINVTREEELEFTIYSRAAVSVQWIASLDAPLRTEEGVEAENLSLSFTGATYDEALNKLLTEFEALDIEVML